MAGENARSDSFSLDFLFYFLIKQKVNGPAAIEREENQRVKENEDKENNF